MQAKACKQDLLEDILVGIVARRWMLVVSILSLEQLNLTGIRFQRSFLKAKPKDERVKEVETEMSQIIVERGAIGLVYLANEWARHDRIWKLVNLCVLLICAQLRDQINMRSIFGPFSWQICDKSWFDFSEFTVNFAITVIIWVFTNKKISGGKGV